MSHVVSYQERNRRRQARSYRRRNRRGRLALVPLLAAAAPFFLVDEPLSFALAVPLAATGMMMLWLREA